MRSTRKTQKPVQEPCVLCHTPTYRHEMGSIVVWNVQSSTQFTKEEVRTTWCKKCERKVYGSKDGARHTQLLEIRDAFAKAHSPERYPCSTCKEERGSGMFHWGTKPHYLTGELTVSRQGMCIMCRRGTRTKMNASLTKDRSAPSPFDIAERQIVQRTGKQIAQWGRKEHHIHCILMREHAGISHVGKGEDSTAWQKIANKWRAWAGMPTSNSSQAFLSDSVLSSNAQASYASV